MADGALHAPDLMNVAKRRALGTLALMVLVVAAKLFVLRWVAIGGGSAVGFAFDVAFVLIAFATADLFFADMRFRAMLIVDFALSVLLLAIAMFVSYYQVVPTRESLATLGQAATVGGSIAELLDLRLLLFFADIPVLVAWGTRLKRRGLDPSTRMPSGVTLSPEMRTPYVYQWRTVYVAATLVAVVFALSVNDLRALSIGGDGRSLSRQYGLSTFLTASMLGPSAQAIAENIAPTGRKLQERIDQLAGRRGDARIAGFESGSARGKNVIVVQMEALQSAVIGLKVDGKEVTPNLNRLIERSWYRRDAVSGVGLGTTSDAEFLVNTGLYPAPQAPSSLRYAERTLPSAPRLLRGQGYSAFTFHTNSVQYWNRSQLYPALGFTRYYDNRYFGDEDKIAFGASDRVLYRRTLEELRRHEASGTPFYAHLIAMSSHFPFIAVPVEERKLGPRGVYKGTIEGDYLTEVNYADRMLGEFIENLEREGLLDESVLVVYGDHFGLPEPRKEAEEIALRELLGHERGPLDRISVPLIVRLPGQTEGRELPRPVGQLDVMPTIADALGVETSSTPHFGRSAFLDEPVLMSAGGLLPPGSYVDDDVLYVPGDTFESGTVYGLGTGEVLGIEHADKSKYERVREMLKLSDAYVRSLPVRADYDPDAKVILPEE